MANLVICDLCGKPIGSSEHSNFKVKKRKWLGYEVYWEHIDVHDECLRKVLDAVHEKGGDTNDRETV